MRDMPGILEPGFVRLEATTECSSLLEGDEAIKRGLQRGNEPVDEFLKRPVAYQLQSFAMAIRFLAADKSLNSEKPDLKVINMIEHLAVLAKKSVRKNLDKDPAAYFPYVVDIGRLLAELQELIFAKKDQVFTRQLSELFLALTNDLMKVFDLAVMFEAKQGDAYQMRVFFNVLIRAFRTHLQMKYVPNHLNMAAEAGAIVFLIWYTYPRFLEKFSDVFFVSLLDATLTLYLAEDGQRRFSSYEDPEKELILSAISLITSEVDQLVGKHIFPSADMGRNLIPAIEEALTSSKSQNIPGLREAFLKLKLSMDAFAGATPDKLH